MHLLRSHSLLRAFRLASLLFCLKLLLLIIAVGILLYAVIKIDWRHALLGFGVAGLALFVGVSRALIAGHIRCPLCMSAVFAPFGNNRHRKARRLLGSYRLRVALSILFRKWFTCPYCNEPTAIKLRPRPHTKRRITQK